MRARLDVDRFIAWNTLAWGAGLVLCLAGGASASTYSVNPTRVLLSAAARSALVTIRNESDQPLRFQLSVMAWSQDSAGTMQLASTEDIVFFPSLLTLAKGEERKIRVGAATAPAAVEKTYRLFIEELPARDRPGEPGAVQVLTRTGIPIFLQPAKAQASAGFSDLDLVDGRFSFTVRNAGTAHMLPMAVKLTASGDSRQLVFEREAKIWYVLAGGTRALDLEMPKPECEAVRALEVTAVVEGKPIAERLATPRGACGSK